MEKLKTQTVRFNGVKVRLTHCGPTLPKNIESAIKAENSKELRKLASRVITF